MAESHSSGEEQFFHLCDLNEEEQQVSKSPEDRLLSLMSPHVSGEISLSDVALNDHGVEFKTLHWYTTPASGERPRRSSIGVRVNEWKAFYGLFSHPGLQIIHISDAPSLKKALHSLIKRMKTLCRCHGCAKLMPSGMLVDSLCSSCNLREALCSKEMSCSICQEETVHYLSTTCNHHFHPLCLIQAKKVWLRDHDNEHDEGVLFPCPNCRTGLEENPMTG